MKKKLKLFVVIVFVVSLLLNGVLIYQNITYSKSYKEHAATIENLTGTVSYYAMKDMGYLGDTAYAYNGYLNKLVKGEIILDDFMNYATGITARHEWPEGLYAIYFKDAEQETKNELIGLVRDCYNAVYIANKKDILAQMNDAQLQNLVSYYGEMEQLLDANKKNNLIVYLRDADYTSTKSKEVQSKLRYVLTCINDLLNEKNINTIPDTEVKNPTSDIAQPIQIEGKFVAKVRAVLPDYVLDDTTPRNVIVTTFQSGPFLINMGTLAEDLEIGKIYLFEIAPKKLGTFKLSEMDNTVLSPDKAIPFYNLRIQRYHNATEEAYSHEAVQLQYAPIK